MSTTIHPLPYGANSFHVPVGRRLAPFDDRLHVMDGDGSSLCERVDAANLLAIDALRWRDVPLSRRCVACRAMMVAYGAGAG